MLRCPGGSEAELLCSCRGMLTDGLLENAFTFSYERMRRYQGGWHLEYKSLFPECIFLEYRDKEIPTELEKRFCDNILPPGKTGELFPITKREQEILRELGGESYCIPMSRGVIRNGITCVVNGPLKGKEQWIKKIDRHKRLAILDPKLFSGMPLVKTGLEITEKTIG